MTYVLKLFDHSLYSLIPTHNACFLLFGNNECLPGRVLSFFTATSMSVLARETTGQKARMKSHFSNFCTFCRSGTHFLSSLSTPTSFPNVHPTERV